MPGLTPTGVRRFTNDEKREFVRLYLAAEGLRGERTRLLKEWGLVEATTRRWVAAHAEGRLGPMPARRRLDVASKERARLVELERENARLRRQVDQAEAAMTIMGKAHELLAQTMSDDPHPDPEVPVALMSAPEYQAWLSKYRAC